LQINPQGDDRKSALLDKALRRSEALRLLAAKTRLTILDMDEAASKLGIRRAHPPLE
jgi:hypothetical protein